MEKEALEGGLVTMEDIEMMAAGEEGKAPLIFHHHLSLCIFYSVLVSFTFLCYMFLRWK
jgi:hypothetical protein